MAALGLSCSMWDLAPWPGIEPGPPALGTQSPSHWTTREVPKSIIFICLGNQKIHVTHFIMIFTWLWFSGTKLLISLRYTCTVFWIFIFYGFTTLFVRTYFLTWVLQMSALSKNFVLMVKNISSRPQKRTVLLFQSRNRKQEYHNLELLFLWLSSSNITMHR